MVTRVIPDSFPVVSPFEVLGGAPASAQIIRRMARAQNWLYSQFRRIYAGHAYEGNGNAWHKSWNEFEPAVAERVGTANVLAKCVSSFYVPRNWCGGTRCKVQGTVLFNRSAGATSATASVYVGLYHIDETPAGVAVPYNISKFGEVEGWEVIIRVPQDQDYQVKVFITYDAGGYTEVNYTNDYVELIDVHARYMEADAQDMGFVPPSTWVDCFPNHASWTQPIADDSLSGFLLKRLVDNINHLYAYRNPELCHTYLKQGWTNSASYVEIGRYVVYIPPRITNVAGDIYTFNTHGGAGNEIRVKLNGTVVQTITVSTGNQSYAVSSFAVTPGQEHTITFEARSTGGSGAFGTCLWGVSLFEAATNINTYPTVSAYLPIDEDGIRGDLAIVTEQDAAARLSGLQRLFLSDVWLARNRRRWLVGDCRHYILKRVADMFGGGEIDARVDWTRGDNNAPWQPGGQRNITVQGDSSAADDDFGMGGWPWGVATSSDYNTIPYVYPSDSTYFREGRMLGIYRMTTSGNDIQSLGNNAKFKVRIRGRRAAPAILSTDNGGFGPQPEDPPYRNKAYYEVVHNGAALDQQLRIMDQLGREPYDRATRWHGAVFGFHVASGLDLRVRGRLPGQLSGMHDGTQLVVRPEGRLFEVELNSIIVIDEPISHGYLMTL